MRIVVSQHPHQVGQWLYVIERKDAGLVIDELIIKGSAADSNDENWNAGAANGLLILADNVTIKRLVVSRMHVGVEVRGHNCTIEHIDAHLISGDVVQGEGQRPVIKRVIASDLLKTLPDDEYHPDVIHWRGNSNGGVIEQVEVIPSDHPLARKDYQGLMFSDGRFEGWSIKDIQLPGCHPEHGVTFSEAHCCTVSNVPFGAVRFRNLNGVASTGCTATNVGGYVEGATTMTNKDFYDAASELGLSGDLPRGIRNNNPGNVEHSPSNKWLGLSDNPSDGRYCRFDNPRSGIRAFVLLLLKYQTEYRLKTISAMLNRYAPRQDNNATDAYIEHVAKAAGVKGKTPVSIRDFRTAKAIVTAIIEFENGIQPYPDSLIIEGIAAAGVTTDTETTVGNVKPVIKSTEQLAVGGAAVGTGGMAGLEWLKTQVENNQTQIIDGLTKAQDQLSGVQTLGWLQVALLVAVLGSIWYLAWRRGEASFLGIR
ncbi:MAG: hypothetical protein ACH34X_11300 [Thiolinea sp.]